MSETQVAEAGVSSMLIEEPETAGPKSEDAGSVSKIIFIQNLVRPFTLSQLKDLLKQSGNIIEKEFWIDKIKSKCFVTYETKKDALKARNTLNGMRWPPSNPKILKADFSNIEQLEFHKGGGREAPLKQMSEQVSEVEKSHPVEGCKKRSCDKPVREWDKDKIIQESPEHAHSPNEKKPRSGQKRELKGFPLACESGCIAVSKLIRKVDDHFRLILKHYDMDSGELQDAESLQTCVDDMPYERFSSIAHSISIEFEKILQAAREDHLESKKTKSAETPRTESMRKRKKETGVAAMNK